MLVSLATAVLLLPQDLAIYKKGLAQAVWFHSFEATGVFAHAPFVEGILINLDEHHLNEAGAKRYAAVARSAFKKS